MCLIFYSNNLSIPAMEITKEILKAATGATEANARKFLPYINETLKKFNINTKQRILAFLAQVGHETAGLTYTSEIADGSAYEGRLDLGNKFPGDGKKFKGRGLIQVTGRENYGRASKYFGVDFVSHPEKLAPKNGEYGTPDQLRYAAYTAGWYWKETGLNELSDKLNLSKPVSDPVNWEIFKKITKRINGGYNGLQDRKTRYEKGRSFAEFINENKGTIGGGLFFF